MVFGSGNKIFRIRRSQSKASYLSYRRDRERGQPDADYGSYKRIISPSNGNNNHNLSLECDRVSGTSEDKWSTNNIHRHSLTTKDSAESKESLVITHNNNNNLLHRLSLSSNNDRKDTKIKQNDPPPPPPSRPCNLPDVLPVSAKMSPPRSLPSPERSPKLQYYNTNSSPKLSSKSAIIQTSPQNSPTKESSPILPPVSIMFSLDKRSSVSSTTSSLTSSNAIPKLESPPPKSPLTSPPHSPEPNTTVETKENLPEKCSFTTVTTVSPPSSPTEKQSSISSTVQSHNIATTSTSTAATTTTTTTATSVSTSTSCTTEFSSKSDPPTPQVIEGLQLIQRTEVVLRVNAATTDAASQTDQQRDTESPVIRTPLPTRRKLQEEIECEQLSRDLANHLSPSDKLKGILVPAPEHKKPTDYVSGLFKLEVTSRPRPNSGTFRNSSTAVNSSTSMTLTSDSLSTISIQKSVSPSYNEPSSPLSATSTYFTTSEPKAKFLTRYSRDMTQFNGVQDTKDLNQKKEELMNRLDRKLEVLRSEQLVVNEENRINDALGEQVTNYVSRLARPQEVAKYRLHVEEVGKITSLLLGLSGRLARAENALMGLSSDHAERKILESKRDKLQEQLEEAKKLKENIDRRSVNVSNILYKYLNSEEYGDYDHFINMKAKLIMDAREIADKIKLGEEQLTALRETLNVKSD